jgi:tellurite methyltransferase
MATDQAPTGPAARDLWNRRWTERGRRALEHDPGAWLVQSRPLLPTAPGRLALDVACGDGRNAGYLARLGFVVDAVDISDVAVAAVRAAATELALPVRARRVDLEQATLPAARYDLIVQLNYLQRDLFGALAEALRPGGVLVMETFTRAHIEQLHREMDLRFVLERDELRTAFPSLDVLRYRESITTDATSPRAVAGLVAQRPRRRAVADTGDA